MILSSPDKQCSLDPVTTWILKKIAGDVVVNILNRSFSKGQVPRRFKSAVVTPLLKTEGLDPDDLNNIRPVSSVSLISKILERLVEERINDHLDVIGTLSQVQSAHRRYHSTETVLTKVVSDIIMAADAGDVSVLALSDLSSAFDTVDHTILLNRLTSSHHIGGIVLEWFESYLRESCQSVIDAGLSSPTVLLEHGVPQGSVSEPLLLIMYPEEIPHLFSNHGLLYVCYAILLSL